MAKRAESKFHVFTKAGGTFVDGYHDEPSAQKGAEDRNTRAEAMGLDARYEVKEA